MKKVGELFKELGFNKDAPLATQKAFFRHLVAHADASRPASPVELVNKPNLGKEESVTETSTQLSFDPHILGFIAK